MTAVFLYSPNTDTMKKFVLIVLSCTILTCCGSTSKAPQDPRAIERFTSFVNEKSFEFVATTAYPTATQSLNAIANSGILPPGNTAGTIQLIGTPNYVKFYGDSVSAYLPFYGERQFGGGLSGNTGIEFKGIPNDYEQTYNTGKERFEIEFDIADKTEVYQINLLLFSDNSAQVNVNSNQRNSIRFSGDVKAIEPKTEN